MLVCWCVLRVHGIMGLCVMRLQADTLTSVCPQLSSQAIGPIILLRVLKKMRPPQAIGSSKCLDKYTPLQFPTIGAQHVVLTFTKKDCDC